MANTTRAVPRLLLMCLAPMLFLATASTDQAQPLKLVAEESAAQNRDPSFFGGADRWTYDTAVIPTSKIPAKASARTVAFGNTVTIALQGLDPSAIYEAELEFLSDSSERALRVIAGSTVLEERLALPYAMVIRRRWRIPTQAIRDGRVELRAERLSGPNVPVSAFRLYSSSPRAIRPYMPPTPRVSLPRYTPRPSSIPGIRMPRLDLCGAWRFLPDAPEGFWRDPEKVRGWKRIMVPGEWALQGFTVPSGAQAAYTRAFRLPGDWRGQRIKMRCDAVYSDAIVYINGREVGRHLGGFTPFEIDITDRVRTAAVNSIAIAVKSASLADRLASGMAYAAHDLGGITRKLYLFAAPALNISDARITTTFDAHYRNATLALDLALANDSAAASKAASVRMALCDAQGRMIRLAPASVSVSAIAPGITKTVHVRLPVNSPRAWDPDHPNLYILTCSLYAGDRLLETVPCRFGFRQVEVRGNRVLVNGHPIKLLGVCRHETDPLRGRSMPAGEWVRDVRLFRDANVNVIRTSHYPPAEEFLDACDRLGMFVEEEAPFCWANDNATPEAVSYIVQAEYEMVMRDRSRPCLLQWSLGNESPWGGGFAVARRLLPALDATRLFVFDGGSGADRAVTIAAPHYPGLGGPIMAANGAKPSFFGEYAHLQCYNRDEVALDPGLRDFWGEGFARMVEAMRASAGCEGGAIWAGIDDIFYLPSGDVRGYGLWGVVDAWRRSRPEYWHVKKAYSPIQVTPVALLAPSSGHPLRLVVHNRSSFSNLSEFRFAWSLAGRTGTAKTAAPPGGKGTLSIPTAGNPDPGSTLVLRVYSPRGFEADRYEIPVGPARLDKLAQAATPLSLTGDATALTIRGRDFVWVIDPATGLVRSATVRGQQVLAGGPELMLVPKRPALGGVDQVTPIALPMPSPTPACYDWRAPRVSATRPNPATVVVRITDGSYREAKGDYVLTFDGSGRMTVEYAFTVEQPLDAWQIGLLFTAPRTMDTLSWQRNAQWSAYPADHIGRSIGSARALSAGPSYDAMGPRTRPVASWSADNTVLGSNDFRSTKRNVREAALTAASGGCGVKLLGEGKQHVRCWLDGDQVRLFAMDYANEGSAPLFAERITPDRRLKAGDRVIGRVTLRLTGL